MKLSPWKRHKAKWGKCTDCSLCETRKNVVLARGSIPCQCLIIGESPGHSEDVMGTPFVGPAGRLLDQIVEMAIQSFEPIPMIAYSNVISCIPLGDDGSKTAEPTKESIRACQPRLIEIIQICKPQLLVYVGKLAATWVPKTVDVAKYETAEIHHPAFILRLEPDQQMLAVKRAVITLSDAFSNLV